MPEIYKSSGASVSGTTSQVIYTGSSSTTSIVNSVNISNKSTTAFTMSLILGKADGSSPANYTNYNLLYNMNLPVGTTLQSLDSPIVLNGVDRLSIQLSSSAASVDAIISLLEMS